MQIRRDEHETEIRFRRHLAKSKKLGGGKRPDFLDQTGEGNLCMALLHRVEELPLPVFDAVKKMQTMPALLRDERRGTWIHGGNFRVPAVGSSKARFVRLPLSARSGDATDNILRHHARR